MKNLIEYFFYKNAKIVLAITRKMNMLKVSKESDVTYSFVDKTLNEFKEEGIVTLTKSGREVIVELTEKGEKLRQLILKVKELEREDETK